VKRLKMAMRRGTPIAGVALCALILMPRGGNLVTQPPPAALPKVKEMDGAPSVRTAAQAALRRAAWYRARARMAVNREREVLEQWDPQGTAGIDWDGWRLEAMARDPRGDLHRARGLARQAATLARTREEARRATELQLLLEHEAGNHAAELRQARKLAALTAGDPRARPVLKRVERCVGRL
jgi:hypothetical protein